MRLSKILLILLPAIAAAQPLAVGFSQSLMRLNDSPGGQPTMRGDTYHLAKSRGGNLIGSFGDGAVGFSCNAGIFRIAPYTYGTPSTIAISDATSSTFCDNSVGYGSESHLDTDYEGACVDAGHACTNKPGFAFSLKGKWYQVMQHSGVQSAVATMSMTILMSPDIDSYPNSHWCNPHTLSVNSGTCPSNSTTLAGDRPTWASGVSGGVMFPNNTLTTELRPILPVDWQDDGSSCPTVEGQSTYLYWFSGTGIYRVTCSAFPNLDKSDWQVCTVITAGTPNTCGTWSSTLTDTPSSVVNQTTGGCSAFWGVPATGSQPNYVYVPSVGSSGVRVLIVAQGYNDGCNGTVFKNHNHVTQSTSIFGPFTYGPFSPDVIVYGTNPAGRKLNGAINNSTNTITITSGCTAGAAAAAGCTNPGITTNGALNYFRDPGTADIGPGASDPTATSVVTPQIITIDSEQMLVTAAPTSTTRTVTREYNGTTAASHSDGAAVIAPYKAHPGFPNVVPGTLTLTASGFSLDFIAEGDEYEANSAKDKANDVYTPIILRMNFALGNVGGLTPIGNTRLRFSAGSLGKKSVPRRGLAWFYDFYDHNGKMMFAEMKPQNLLSGASCTPGSNAAGPTLQKMWWKADGLWITNGNSYQPYCVTSENWPITGNTGFTVTWVGYPSSLTGFQTIGNVGYYGNSSGGGMAFGIDANGSVFMTFDNTHSIASANNKCAANTYCMVTFTKPASTNSDQTTIYVNGAPVCGPGQATSCTVGGGAIAPNTQAQPFYFGIYGNGGSANCGTTGTNCNFQNSFTGMLVTFAVWIRNQSGPEIHRMCEALKANYGRAPRSIVLTCN